MRLGTTLEALLSLPPYLKKDGFVTAGNASGICDGAAATAIACGDFVGGHKLAPIGRSLAWGTVGAESSCMGIGPAPAAVKALHKADLALEEMELMESTPRSHLSIALLKGNSARSADKPCPHGVIAIGHPLAASGTRITTYVFHALQIARKGFDLTAARIGGGQGTAVIVEEF